jgi:carboxyl-terminal processing protease
MKKRFSVVTVAVAMFLALFLGIELNTVFSGDNIFEQITKFKDVLSLAEKNYVDDVDSQKLVESAIVGMLEDLDPHSVYIPASALPKINEEFAGSFEGIGVEYDVINDTLQVQLTVAGGPSEALGIMSGDKIVKINDTSSVGIKRDDVPKKLRGPKGTHVKVTIHRPGVKDLIDFDITRDKIPLYTVDVSYMVTPEIGYISVNRFASTTYAEFLEGVNKLRAQGMKRLVLDLRNNGGGYLDQAYRMADELLPKGKKIVYTKGRRPEFNEEYVSQGGNNTDLGLIILVNNGTASASEIVSGAMQDWDRGLIVGETTFGKGLVQRQYELADKSAFRLTTARYYTPTGRLIQRPYGKDKDAYRKAAFERNEVEGENLEHTEESDSTRPVFKTAAGRKVFGGGGITPDYIIKAEKLTDLSVQILGKGVFQEYSLNYMDRNGKSLRSEYKTDLARFRDAFTVTPEMEAEFKALAVKKGVTMNEEQLSKDMSYIRTRIKAQIARSLYANEGWYSVMRSEDNQFQKALTLFPEAEKIARLH